MTVANSFPGKMLLWLGAKQVSDIIAFLTSIVISVYALSVYGDPAILGIILTLRMVGSVVGAFLVSRLTQRISLSSVLVLTELCSAATMIILVISPVSAHNVLLPVVVAGIGMFHGAFHVALYSQVHLFVSQDNHYRINSILASMDGVAVVFGGITSSLLYEAIPIKFIFLIDAATFVIAAYVFLMFRRTTDNEAKRAATPQSKALRRIFVSGHMVRVIMVSAGFLLAARFLEAFGSATHNVGFPILSELYSPDNPAFLIGWIMASWGLGKTAATIASTPMIRVLSASGLRQDLIFVLFLGATFLFFLGVFQANGFWVPLMFAYFAGLFDASTETVYYSSLQNNDDVPTEMLIGASYILERVGMGGGILLVGFVYSAIDEPGIVAVSFYLSAAFLCVVLIAARSVLRKCSWYKEYASALSKSTYSN